jgi:hypothetical protein
MLQSADLEVAAKELNSRFGGEVVPPGDPATTRRAECGTR